MNLLVAVLCLNEVEHLPSLWEQHRAWPGVSKFVFVESADRIFADCNPDLVSEDGLSTDGTSEFLADLAARDSRVTYIPFGFCSHPDPAQGKVQARQQYLDVAEKVKPDFILVQDADEMYAHAAQREITRLLKASRHAAHIFKQRHIWRPPSLSHLPLFTYEVTGGYWSVPHTRVWRWESGMRYKQNHNWPEDRHGRLLTRKSLMRYDRQPGTPECCHLGYASSLQSRQAKARYYVARGEGSEGGRLGQTRRMYVECRNFHLNYQPGDALSSGVEIVRFQGNIPEVFLSCPAAVSSLS